MYRITTRRIVALVVALAAGVLAPAAASAPANDHFADAQLLEGANGVVAGINFGASRETGEPNHAGNPGGRSVWYRWTAPADGQVAFVTLGSDFDTLLGVYTGTSLPGLQLVAASEDAGDGDRASMLSFRASAGTEYRIAVDGFFGKVGKIRLHWTRAPANDNFADGEALEGRFGSARGTIAGATWQEGEPFHVPDSYEDGGAGATVWYAWTAPVAGLVSFTVEAGSFDALVAAYTGTSVDALTLVGLNDDDPFLGCCDSRLMFAVSAGQTYRIAVDRLYGGGGPFVVEWRPVLLGTARADRIVGTAGNEEIRALGGADTIRPGGGDDVVFAGGGADRVAGGAGNDIVHGAGGRDRIVDRRGDDVIYAGAGADAIDARDGAPRDYVSGGGGRDVCVADRGDNRVECP